MGAAITVFAARGYAASTIDAVGVEAGLSKGAVYTYFASKEELFVAASQQVFEKRYQALSEMAGDGDEVSIDTIVANFAASLLRSDHAFLRLWVEGFLLASDMPALADLKVHYHRRFGELVSAALRATQAGSDPDSGLGAEVAAEAAMALADGLMLYALVPGLGPDADAIRRAITDQLAARQRGARG